MLPDCSLALTFQKYSYKEKQQQWNLKIERVPFFFEIGYNTLGYKCKYIFSTCKGVTNKRIWRN